MLINGSKKNRENRENREKIFLRMWKIFILHVILVNIFEISEPTSNFLYSGFLFILMGFIDDSINFNYISRLIFQIFTIIIIVSFFDLRIQYLGNYHLTGDLIFLNSQLSIIFTTLCVVLMINAFNFIDGIDMLGGLIFISFLVFSYLYSKNLDIYLIVTLLVPIIIFLFFNNPLQKKYKIFLGNNGSYYLGYLISILSIHFSQSKEINLEPNYLIWILSYIVFDFCSVLIIRINKGKNIMKTDKSHLHDILYLKYKNTKTVLIKILIIIIALSFIPLILKPYSYYFLYLYIIFFILFHYFKKTYNKIS